ncbi:hypothetical protein Pla100_56890 [Neorhodopirellula pilleata]|uniref:Uncharacterized protein n=1 Tax=Neorhodopirellula pilleata TaxID=2714738 RepID=A0A5C5ZQZ5_9BACT|nr:hypothetical protein Pla100_56890 [Neorhodopirellula pilleata]
MKKCWLIPNQWRTRSLVDLVCGMNFVNDAADRRALQHASASSWKKETDRRSSVGPILALPLASLDPSQREGFFCLAPLGNLNRTTKLSISKTNQGFKRNGINLRTCVVRRAA